VLNIVLIDDNEDIRDLISAFLPKEKYFVFFTSNGNVGLEYIKNNHVDLLITDILMPNISGLEVIKEATSINPKLKIIAISGGGVIDTKQYFSLASGLGAQKVLSKVLSKPFITEDLLSIKIKELFPEP